MKDFKVKIISPDNEKTELNYFDILFFCQKKTEEYISLSDENLIRFRNFRKNYTIFDPYFDFVILELKYILLNPFFEKDEYLLPYNGKYYINSLYNTSINYDDLINKKPTFDFMPATDYNICRNKKTLNKDTRIGFCVDSEGNIYNNDILQINYISEYFDSKTFVDFSTKYARIKYEDSNGKVHTLNCTDAIGKDYTTKALYFKVPSTLKESKKIDLVYTVNGKKYTYHLKK